MKILAKELKVLGRYLKGVNWVKYPRFLLLKSTDWSVIFVMFFCLGWISSVSRTVCKSAREVDNFIYVVDENSGSCG